MAAAAAILVLPLAAAASAQAYLVLSGPAIFPASATLEAEALGLFLNGTGGLRDLTLTTTEATVHRMHVEFACVNIGAARVLLPLSSERATYPLHDVHLELVSTTTNPGWRGWMGVYPDAGTTLSVRISDAAVLKPALHSRLGNGATTEAEPSPTANFYARSFETPHLTGAVTGSLTLRGGGMMKIDGATVRIQARENTTTHRTGESPPQPGACHATAEWLVLEYAQGELVLDSANPVDLRVGSTDVEWSGAARLENARGAVAVEGDEREASLVETLSGDFRANLSPINLDATAAALFRAEGETHTLSPRTVSLVNSPWSGALVLGGLVAVASAGAGLRHVIDARWFRRTYPEPGMADFRRAIYLIGRGHSAIPARLLIRAVETNPALVQLIDQEGCLQRVIERKDVHAALVRADETLKENMGPARRVR